MCRGKKFHWGMSVCVSGIFLSLGKKFHWGKCVGKKIDTGVGCRENIDTGVGMSKVVGKVCRGVIGMSASHLATCSSNLKTVYKLPFVRGTSPSQRGDN